MQPKQLIKFGLNEKEASVYLALLELGKTNIERISRKSKIKRSTVYEIIKTLKEKGFIESTIQKSKRLFYAHDPRILEESIAEKYEEIQKLMPELLSISNLIDKKPKVRYFEGEEELKEIYKETLKFPNQEVLAWVTDQLGDDFDESWYMKQYIPRRIKNRVWVRAIGIDSEVTRKYQAFDQKQLRQMKLCKSTEFSFLIEINIFGTNHLTMVSHKEKIGLIIESTTIHSTLKSMFEIMWRSL